MARSLFKLANSLCMVLLLAMEASGSVLTLENFESISTMSLPLECAFAYNTPLRGCSMEDFGEGKMCSSTCIDNILAVETKIQDSCALARTESTSLLDQAQQGRLVITICGNRQSPTAVRASSSISFPRPGTFSRIPFDTPSPTSPRLTTKPKPSSTTSATPTPSPTMTSTMTPTTTSTASSTTSSTSEDDGDVSTPTPTIGPIATTSRIPVDSTGVQVTTTSTATSSSADERPPRRTQPPGGGGSPFDFVPGTASQKSIDFLSKMLAILSFALAMYVNVN